MKARDLRLWIGKEGEEEYIGPYIGLTEATFSVQPIGGPVFPPPLAFARHTVRVKPARWFLPIITIKDARITGYSENSDDSGVRVNVTWRAAQGDMEWQHWLARPVYWLWRQWQAVRVLFGGGR
jgi:hypothetical protein